MKRDFATVLKNLDVEVRQDGCHLSWFFRHPVPDDALVPGLLERHEIIVKSIISPQIPKDAEVRIRAFVCTMVEDASTSASPFKKIQKKREEDFAQGTEVPWTEQHQQAYDLCVKLVGDWYRRQAEDKLIYARSSLRMSVLQALEALPYDECEEIIRNALAESVMKS